MSVSSQLAPQRSQTPSGATPSGIEEISQTVAPPTSSQDGASQDKRTVVQGSVRTSLTQLGVIPQETPEQSLTQSESGEVEPPMLDLSSEGELPDLTLTRRTIRGLLL